tara:strand:- start:1215 stop:1739 length:525 start_codon:yes stop_codon:yes gene_type:complete
MSNYYTEELKQVTPALEDFIEQCTLLGWKNNSSLKELRWEWCLEGGMWYATYNDDKIISLTGIHPFKDGYRALYRGAQLSPRPIKGLSRYQMQSWGIYDHLPLQIEFAKGKPLYITTNIDKDNSGRMNRIHKSFTAMAKGGMVDYIDDEKIFNALQSVWKLNVNRYFEIRNRYV